MRIINEGSHKADNPNIRRILREFSADYI